MMQIATHWQPAYTPPGYQKVERVEVVKVHTKDRILAFLKEHGPTPRHILLEKLAITSSVFRHATQEIQGQIAFEQVGCSKTRHSLYWLPSNPPPLEKRSASHQLHEWFKSHPWHTANDIPDSIYKAKHKHCCVFFLVQQSKLISRVKDGVKQYRSAA